MGPARISKDDDRFNFILQQMYLAIYIKMPWYNMCLKSGGNGK